MNQIVENAPSRNVEEFFERFLYPDLDANDFQNVNSSSSSTDTYISGKISIQILFVVLGDVASGETDRQTDKQTDRQTNAR